MRRPLVAGNWKMNGTCTSVTALLSGLLQQQMPTGDKVEFVVFPSYVHICQAVAELKASAIEVGGQNCANRSGYGALTGEISADQLADTGCRWVLVGHSERRQELGETNAQVAECFVAAKSAGLKPMLCVGETLDQREQGMTLSIIEAQLEAVIELSGIQALSDAVIAYEPVWAIGTGKTATPEQAQDVHANIRAYLGRFDAAVASGVRLLYGGSVKADNAADLFRMPDIDGGLIGGASLNAEEFCSICRAAEV